MKWNKYISTTLAPYVEIDHNAVISFLVVDSLFVALANHTYSKLLFCMSFCNCIWWHWCKLSTPCSRFSRWTFKLHLSCLIQDVLRKLMSFNRRLGISFRLKGSDWCFSACVCREKPSGMTLLVSVAMHTKLDDAHNREQLFVESF